MSGLRFRGSIGFGLSALLIVLSSSESPAQEPGELFEAQRKIMELFTLNSSLRCVLTQTELKFNAGGMCIRHRNAAQLLLISWFFEAHHQPLLSLSVGEMDEGGYGVFRESGNSSLHNRSSLSRHCPGTSL